MASHVIALCYQSHSTARHRLMTARRGVSLLTFSGVSLFPIHDRIGPVFAALAACCGRWFPIRIYFWLCEEIHSTSSAVTGLWLFLFIDQDNFEVFIRSIG